MEINKDNYNSKLGSILDHLTHADFVAIDFEFSGIKVKPARTVIEQMGEGPLGPEAKPTLQERYEELKLVAEKYTIFQVGITIGEQDKASGSYVLRPCNAHLNPLILHKMDIDRDVTMLSSALLFLQKNRFAIHKPFTEGVPYLSRGEHRRAIQLESERLDGVNIPDMDFQNLDLLSQSFLDKTRQQILSWKPTKKDEVLFVQPPRGAKAPFEMVHRRIVYQLVRNEFPHIVVTSQNNSVKLLLFDEERERKHKIGKMDSFFGRLSRQTGFRWVIEAIVGGDLSDLSAADLYVDENTSWIDFSKAKKELDQIRKKLKARRPVLIGHNPFTDLVFLYNTFIGPLPQKVEDFTTKIHELFPMIVDTKYLATHHGVIESSSLQQLAAEHSKQRKPVTCSGKGYENYDWTQAMHEAGYDSYLTAQLAVKSAAKLAVCSNWRESLKANGTARADFTNSFTNSPTKTLSMRPKRKIKTKLNNKTLVNIDSSEEEDEAKAKAKPEEQASPPNHRTMKEIAYKRNAIFTPLDLSYSRQQQASTVIDNVYSLLPKPVEPAEADPDKWTLAAPERLPRWMPAWDSDFWLVFGNKLRVNGTVEGMLDLVKPKKK